MEQQQVSPKIIWFGFVGTIAVYIFIAYQSAIGNNQEVTFRTAELSNSLFLFVAVVSIALIAVAHKYIPKLIKKSKNPNLLAMKQLQYALSEAAALLGLILFFAKGSFSQLIILCSMSFLSLLALYPGEDTGSDQVN